MDENFEKPVLIIGLLSMILIITADTINRYLITGLGLPNVLNINAWAGEVSRFIFIYISYFSMALGIKRRSNIRMDALYNVLPKRWQEAGWIAINLFFLFFTVIIFSKSVEIIQMQMDRMQLTPALRIPYYIPYMILPIGFGLMSIRLVVDLWKTAKAVPIKDTLICVAFTVISLLIFLNINLGATLVLFTSLIFFVVIGVPIAIALGLATVITIMNTDAISLRMVSQFAYSGIDKFPLLAIPFFVAAGVFMGAGGLSTRLLNVADEIIGGITGGYAIVTIATCMLFAAISGSGPATVAAIGAITIPAMIQRGYSASFATAIVAAAGAIGVMIPPSNPFIIYGVAAQQSVGRLFMAGIIPGILMGLLLMLVAYVISKKNGWKGSERKRSIKTLVKAIWDAKFALLVPFIILGGIYGGFMTPTEAGAVAAFYGLFVGVVIYRQLNWKTLPKALVDAAMISGVIMALMATATMFGYLMTVERIPNMIADAILSVSDNPVIILLIISAFLLFIGTFLEALAAIVILVPILLPIVVALDINLIHFGVIMVVNLAIGFVTPPVGVNLFVAMGISKVEFGPLVRAMIPFLLILLVGLLIIMYVPQLSMYLPDRL
ncbi:TRAP transporter large permease subunit [Desulfitispora alkaliphila]|uniref:TRAP transporter large permease n=1 Tax=Desulfitispora alkaliphila TaxID=622674 RepID=UPI003D1CE065